jgi:hypothetical protein
MITPTTSSIAIVDYNSLQESIRQLKAQKLSQEAMIKAEITTAVNSLSPAKIVKDSLQNLISDKEVRVNIAKIGLNLGANLLTMRLFGRYRSIPVFLGIKVIQKVAGLFLKDKFSTSSTETIQLLEQGSETIHDENNASV